MVSILCAVGVDLTWADDQYWSTLSRVVGEITKMRTPKKKEKVTTQQMAKYIQ